MAFFAFILTAAVIVLNLFPFLLVDTKKVLTREFEYYRNLDEPDQEEFRIRIAAILKSKAFIGMEGVNVTPKMKILVAAAFPS